FGYARRSKQSSEDKMAIRIFIADDADLTIRGMQTILQEDHRFDVVGTARSMDELLATITEQCPDVIILGEWLYNMDLLSGIEQLQTLVPTGKIIVLGSLADGLLIRDLFHAGAQGYLYKSDDLCDCLTLAVDTVLRDRKYLSHTANAEYLVAMQSPQRDWHLDHEARHILQMLARGHRACEIAESLDIETRRVYHVRQKLRKRFNAETNEHLISVAAAEGFIYP
ncbi:MAG: response regulator transcription factor, partial [Chloroflexota bacterium]